MISQMKYQESSNIGVVGDRNALAADLQIFKQNRARLEAVIIDAQKLIEEKVSVVVEILGWTNSINTSI